MIHPIHKLGRKATAQAIEYEDALTMVDHDLPIAVKHLNNRLRKFIKEFTSSPYVYIFPSGNDSIRILIVSKHNSGLITINQ